MRISGSFWNNGDVAQTSRMVLHESHYDVTTLFCTMAGPWSRAFFLCFAWYVMTSVDAPKSIILFCVEVCWHMLKTYSMWCCAESTRFGFGIACSRHLSRFCSSSDSHVCWLCISLPCIGFPQRCQALKDRSGGRPPLWCPGGAELLLSGVYRMLKWTLRNRVCKFVAVWNVHGVLNIECNSMLNLCIFAFYTQLRHRVGIHNECLTTAVNQCWLQQYVWKTTDQKIYQNFNLRLTEQTMTHS